jgi:hypothetical protein
VQANDPDISQFASASNKSLWEKKAKQYFSQRYWRLARQAYENAGLLREASIATAYYLREHAMRFPRDDDETRAARSKAYMEAAHAFSQVAPTATNADDSRSYYRITAECFMEVPDETNAATAFEQGRLFSQAMELYHRHGDLERTVQLLCGQYDLEPGIIDRVRYDAQLFCAINARIT